MSYDRHVRAAALLLLLPACDVVFGLDRDPPAVDAAIDAPPERVSGRFVLRYVTNAVDGTPLEIEEPHPGVMLTVYAGDEVEGTALPLSDDGEFTFERPPGTAYRLIWTNPLEDNVPTEWQTSLPRVEIATLSAGRPTRLPVTLPTPLTFTTPTTVGTHVVMSTGLWTETGIPGDAMDWKQAYATSPPLGLLDASRNDRLFYVVRTVFVDTATGFTYTAYGSEATKAVTIGDGVPQNITLAFATSNRDQCARIGALRATAMQRVALAAGPGTTASSDDWLVLAAPSSSSGPVGALTLAFHVEVSPTPASNQVVNVAYRNLFAGHAAIATMGAFFSRTITAPAAAGLVVSTGVRVYTPVAPCPALTALDATQGIPGAISLAGVQLTGPDGTQVPIDPNAPLTLSWSLAVPGPVDVSGVTIYEVTAQDGKTVLVPILRYRTLEQMVRIAPNMLQPGARYIARVDAAIGYPNTATGDLRTVQYPYGNATQWSRVFEISTP